MSGANGQSAALPHSIEAEQGVLGSMLIAPREVTAIVMESRIGPEHFYTAAHRTIFGALADLWNNEPTKAIDPITFCQALSDRNLLDEVGGASYITQIFVFVPTASNIRYYIEILREKYILREIIAACIEGQRRAYEEQSVVAELLDEVQARVTAIALDSVRESPVKAAGPVMIEVMTEIEEWHKHRGRTLGMATGFIDLDRMTRGVHQGEMTLLGGRPSMGKTALGMQIVEHIALDRFDGDKRTYRGQPVLIFSIETAMKRLLHRSVSARARMNLQDAKLGFLSKEKIEEARRACMEFEAAPIYIDDSPSLRLQEFKARCRRYVALHGIKLVVIDYGQLMRSPSKRAEFSKALEIADVSQGIKEIGRELNVAMLVLVQLNREVESSRDPRPRMSNLRESGQLEQDADHIWLLHRPEYYLDPEKDAELLEEVEGKAILIVAKQKDGPVGDIRLTFLKEYMRFEDSALAGGETRPMYSNNPRKRQNALA